MDGSWNQQQDRITSRARILSLEDILQAGPFEQEAETHILKALEHDYPESYNRKRSDTATSTILRQVPESASTISPCHPCPPMERTEYDHEISRAQNTEEEDDGKTGKPVTPGEYAIEAMSEQQQMKPLLQAHHTDAIASPTTHGRTDSL
jgi:hypothetical protein